MHNKSNPTVTIYITNYNYGKYIEQAIQSVLKQTYQDFELIIIDDGSTDNSREIIAKYEDIDGFRFILQNNKGLNASNNVALMLARGKYIMRLDADDYLADDAIEKIVKIIDSDPNIALVFPDYYEIDSNGNIIREIKRHNFAEDVTLYDQPAHGACTMIRKNILIKVGKYDEDFDRQDGYDLWLKVINKYKINNINEPLFYYRQHGINLTIDNYSLLKTRAKIKKSHVEKGNYGSLNTLTIIPVRGITFEADSREFELLGNKYLIDWTIESAMNSKLLNDMVISTPDKNLQKYISQKYQNDILIVNRNPNYALINMGIEETIEEALTKYLQYNSMPDAIMILYINYPFKKTWQLDEVVHTMQLFKVDVVDGIILDDRFYYKHDGSGLKPIVKGGGLHLERDQFYRRVGGVHLINTEFFLKHKKMVFGKIGHIMFDEITGFQIKSDLDFKLAESILELGSIKS